MLNKLWLGFFLTAAAFACDATARTAAGMPGVFKATRSPLLIEINEAFAAVALVSCRSILGMTKEDMFKKVNINGGAVAYGHPIGATGARIAMTLGYELKRRGGGWGVCGICSGHAQGDAMLIRVD